MNIGASVMTSLRWLFGARLLGQIISWTISIVIIRLLEPQDYGLMALVMLVVGFLTLFNELGLSASLVQRESSDRQTAEQVLGVLIVLNLVLYGLLLAVAPLFSAFFNEPRMLALIGVAGLQLPVAALAAVPESLLVRRMAFRRKSAVEFIAMLFSSLTTLGFAVAGMGVWSLVYGSLALAVVRTIGMSVAAGFIAWPRFSLTGLRTILTFGGWVTADRLLYYTYSSSDVLIVGKLLGKDALGVYSVAEQLASLPNQKISGILNEVGFAAFSRIQNDAIQVRAHFCKAVRLVSAVSLPVAWGLSSVAPELVQVVLGTKWSDVAPLLALISLVTPLWMIAGVSTPALLGLGRPEVGVKSLVASLAIMPVAFLIGAGWGVLGVAVAGLVAYPIVFAIRMRLTLPILGVSARDYLGLFRGFVLASAGMYMAVTATRGMLGALPDAAVLAVLFVVGVTVYTAIMRFTQPDTFRELLAVLRI
jgi:O-antigen/teichoic acid export membrane protein